VRERREGKLGAGPENDLAAKPGEVDHRDAARRNQLENEIAVSHGIEGVCGGGGKPQLARERLSVDGKAATGERTGAQWRHVGAPDGILHPAAVTMEH